MGTALTKLDCCVTLKPPGLVFKMNVKDLEIDLETWQGNEQCLNSVSSLSSEDQILTGMKTVTTVCLPFHVETRIQLGAGTTEHLPPLLEKFIFAF